MTSYKIEELIGKTVTNVVNNGYEIVLTIDGQMYKMDHNQDCCESVLVDEVIGNLDDLVGVPILTAEESISYDNPKCEYDCCTWTTYNFTTVKGCVTIRWYGESNGYYSTSVDLWRE